MPFARWMLTFVGFGVFNAIPASSQPTLTRVCLPVQYLNLSVAVRDTQGRPIARGASLEVRFKKYRDRIPAARASRSALWLVYPQEVAGTFDVRVEKPGYAPAETTGVYIPDGECHAAGSAQLALVLRELPGKPRVRSVTILGSGMGLGPGEISSDVYGHVDATEGIDTSIVWSSSDTSIFVVSPTGTVTSRCLTVKRYKTAYVIATSRADRRKRARAPIEVWGDSVMCRETRR
jgi:hypothetical protein